MTGPGHHAETTMSPTALLAPTTAVPAHPGPLTAAEVAASLPRSGSAALCGPTNTGAPSDSVSTDAPNGPRVQMHPVTRRIIYAVLYEGLSLLFTIVVLGLLLGHGGGESTVTAVLLSTVATVWNYVWNTLFERAERRFGWTGRGLFVRVLHAIGYEGGVLVFTIPLVAFMLQVSLLEALAIESSMLVFFLVFTFVYSWAFDKTLGLPESAR